MVSKIVDIDPEIYDILVEINNHPNFKTVLSCAGHYKLCKAFISQYKSFDDFVLSEPLYNYSDIGYDKYCRGTTQPFLYFKILIRDKHTDNFLKYLSTKHTKTEFPYILHVEDNVIHYSYGDGDEGYDPADDTYSIYPRFAEFWNKFIIGWKRYISPQSTMQIPSNFRLNYNWCNKCNRQNTNTKNLDKEFVYLDTELYAEEYHCQLIDIYSRK